MPEERIQNYKKYLEIKGYQSSTIRGLLRTAKNHINQKNPQQQLTNNTQQLYYYQKKVYINYLNQVENQNIHLSPEHYKKTLSKIEVLTLEEIRELEQGSKTLREQVVIHCLYSLGLRLSEVSNLELQDIDFTQNLVHIKKSKTKKQRQIPINKKTQQIITHYIDQERSINKGRKLLQGLKGDLSPDGIYQNLKRIVKRTTIKKRIYPHLLRHSIASHLLQRGMDIEQIGKYLGHTSIESTQRYTHLAETNRNE